jgi:uncharacterized protein YukE
MAKAVVDPAEVRRFASDLKRFNTDLHSQLGQLNARFRQLGQTWRDQEHRKFAEEWDQAVRVLTRFNKVTQEHIPFLMRKAARAEDYLDQR